MTRVVFTNGCFDLLHPGHVDLLNRAKALGDKLIVGVNSDESVRSIKGFGRPVQTAEARKAVLMGLKAVDEVLIFQDLTPERLIREVRPDVLVKGGDWKESEIVGADFVKANGGEVHSLPLVDGYSSSKLIEASTARPEAGTPSDDLVANSFAEHSEIFERLTAQEIEDVRT